MTQDVDSKIIVCDKVVMACDGYNSDVIDRTRIVLKDSGKLYQ